MTKDQAIKRVLIVLRNPLMLMSIPDREEAIKLAQEHNISAEDLLSSGVRAARNA